MSEFVLSNAHDNCAPPIRMDGVEYCQVAFFHPFEAAAPTAEEWRLYIIRGDNIALDSPALAGADGDLLQNGTVIGMAGHEPHLFKSAVSSCVECPIVNWSETPLGSVVAPSQDKIIIGRIPQSSMPFLSIMGGFIRIDPAEHGDVTARIGLLMDWIAEETVQKDATSGDIVLRLAEIITMEIGRVGSAHSVLFDNRPRNAEYDPRIWRAISAICLEPQRQWTVATMAQIAGMSRSAFATRYHETVGQTPVRSLRRLRMHRAATMLATPGAQAIAQLADDLGYGSDAAFNRAFTKEFGYPPKRYGTNNAAPISI